MKTCIPHIYTLLAGAMLMAAAGCSDDLDFRGPGSDDIRFTASFANTRGDLTRSFAGLSTRHAEVLPMSAKASADSMYLHSEVIDFESQPATRSNMVSSTSGMYDRINISAYYYDTWDSTKAKYQPNYFYFEGAGGALESGYSLDNTRYWPSEGNMRFIAFAPYEPSNTGAYVMANVDESTGPYVHIEVSEDVSSHKDLVVAYSQEVGCEGTHTPVNLNFKHAMACVQFVMAEDMEQARIKSIAIKGVTYWGDMRFADNMTDKASSSSADANISNSYYPWGGTRDFTLNLVDSSNPNGKEVSANDIITDDSHSFFMFPQIVPTGAQIEITLSRLKNGVWGADETMYGYISGKHWPAGKIIRYRLSNERWWQELQVSQLPAYSHQGGVQNFSITSFDTSEDGDMAGVEWTVKYEDPSNPGTFIDSRPSWYRFDTTNSGSVTPQSVALTVDPSPIDHTVDLDGKLKSAAVKGTQANPYNLSTGSVGKTTVGTTANCYIVDAPGWYIIPLVYGNGVVSGSPNTTAYAPGTGGTNNSLAAFVNHKGNAISSPYILTDCSDEKAQITSTSAGIVWQDVQNLIRSSSVSVDPTAFGGNGGILFQVTASDIIQGNCVIGLKAPGKSDEMMWSWHIWVTSFFTPGLDPLITETIGITNNAGMPFNLMYVNLGWCSEKPLEIYAERTSKVQFTATTHDGRVLTKTLDVVQAPLVEYWHGRNTYYQWGRKDPFQPFLVSFAQTWYDSTGASRWQNPDAAKFGAGVTALQERVMYPSTFHSSDFKTGTLDNGNTGKIPTGADMYTNLWDATYNSPPVKNKYDKNAIDPISVPTRTNVKSVYDPSPAGYKVPPIDTFTGFTTTGNNVGDISDTPKNWNGLLTQYDYNCGNSITEPYVYLFYTDQTKLSYIAFPLTGYRDWAWVDVAEPVTASNGIAIENSAGYSYQMGNYGYTWTAGAGSTTESYYLELRKDPATLNNGLGWIMPLDYYWQLDGMPVRPSKE